ncbi:MAG: sulfatase [Verrucomicrobiales bacterium]|nr:sulfatase [Verrucomicrobiales bacterium]
MDLTSIQQQTRRHFFEKGGVGLGSIALSQILAQDGYAGGGSSENPMAQRGAHYGGKAKNVIFMFMAGGPSHLELFEDKPKLREFHGQLPPESLTKGKRFAFLGEGAKLLGSERKFDTYGNVRMPLSELLPHHRKIADEVCWLRGMKTEVFNHGPAKLFMNTGFQVPGRPSMGSWVTYGIGSASRDLPGFVVLQSGPRGPRGGNALWSAGFLPSTYQGVPFRGSGDPILNLNSPEGFTKNRQRDFVDLVGSLNRERLSVTGDPEIATRINAYEMAYRMQTSAPELMDLSGESQATLDLYGAERGGNSYANNCLLARRLVERGVRFVQLYHTDWDHHGGPGQTLGKDLEKVTKEVDQASTALVLDLKQRGLLDDTIVIWGGEFGRTPMGETRNNKVGGRDHHIDAFTMWIAGGGFRSGITYGKTDEFGYEVVDEKVHVHDLHATILHQLGIDHEQLTYRFQGRDFRLTDVFGNVVEPILV